MSNQVILWSMLLTPFLTLFFMKKEDVKRYMPVGLFSAVTSAIIGDVGVTLGFWVHRETAYPLHSLMPFDIGLNLVLTMWVFIFTYRRFWMYMITNAILDIGFDFFLFQYYFPSRDIFNLVGISPFQSYLITLGHALVIYGYQMWQEGILVRSERTTFLGNLQPATKPLSRDQENKPDDE
ncbi:Hypothetical protein LUCI_1721 [Lucifera butyrica]|uniref:Lycopene cyclase domain-containing protein n=1 Tax=Lucifera butyrica TaxID=1351585 RepID=A0A498RBH8_9FIRM|nr:hypothetical protein [Lucifera butyrica]VBB06488.1 Hypothetical protein LUCI_1721 [Lucifera butyrica]